MDQIIYMLCNPGESFNLLHDQIQIINSHVAWESLVQSDDIKDALCFIVVSELSWEATMYLAHQGFDYINKLRLQHHYQGPILISSIFPKEDLGFFSFKGKFRYWRDPSLSFIPYSELLLIDGKGLINQIPTGLDTSLYKDLCQSVYEIRGIIKEEFHFFEGEKRNNPENLDAQLKALFNRLASYFPEYQPSLSNLAKDSLDTLNDKGVVESDLLLEEVLNILGNTIDTAVDPSFNFSMPEKGKILYIDDRHEGILVNALEKGGFKVLYEDNKDGAIRRLKEDVFNEITIVICNYRFLDSENRFKRDQGYHILEAVSELPNMVKTIILTSSHPSNVFIQNKNAISVHKQHILTTKSNQNLVAFLSLIIEEHERIQQTIVDLPNNNLNWQFYYKKHRESTEYVFKEKWISRTTLLILEEAAKNNGEKSVKEIHDFRFQGKFLKNKKVKNLENIRKKLLGRRIALGLSQMSKVKFYSQDDRWYVIDSFLKTGCFDVDRGQRPNNLINTNLKLSIKKNYNYSITDNQGLTIEERNWLRTNGKFISEL